MLRILSFALILIASAVSAGPNFWSSEWPNTDFTRTSVDFAEIFSGGPPKDGIPAITGPRMLSVADEDALGAMEPVVVVELDGETPRAYPIRYLTWHEIVNDRIGDVPVAVTFCPLCNSAITFDTRVGGRELEFGVSGKLRRSDMVMYDRNTESWWQQFLGEAIIGELQGTKLTVLPTWMESWESFSTRHPDGLVMAQPAGHRRDYGRNPYTNYDRSQTPFLYRGDPPPHGIRSLSRVVAVGDRAWPLSRLAEAGELVEDGVRLTWRAGQASALGASEISEGRDVGNVRTYDAATGQAIPHDVAFAFAFHAFHPEGTWMLGE